MKLINLKLNLALLACLALSTPVVAQRGGFTLSLREDLVDFSTMSVDGAEQNPYGTAYRHTFGTELSLGYRLMLDDNWELGISAGVMLHDYSLTGIFHSWDHPASTTDDGLFTQTERQTYDKQTALSLPIVLNVKYLLEDWSETMLWDVIPLISARAGYVLGLTKIEGEYYNELTVNPVPNPYGLTPGTEREWRTTRFDRQGWFAAVGIGVRYGHLDVELEYSLQPRHFVVDQRFENPGTSVNTNNNTPSWEYSTSQDNSDGLTLRLTYNF